MRSLSSEATAADARARLDGLRTAMSVLAFFALIGLLFSRRMPDQQAGSSKKPASGPEAAPAATRTAAAA